jgi:hypothetical protein
MTEWAQPACHTRLGMCPLPQPGAIARGLPTRRGIRSPPREFFLSGPSCRAHLTSGKAAASTRLSAFYLGASQLRKYSYFVEHQLLRFLDASLRIKEYMEKIPLQRRYEERVNEFANVHASGMGLQC